MRAALKKSRPLLEWGCRSPRLGRTKLFRRKFDQLGRPYLLPHRAIPSGKVITLPTVVPPLQRLKIGQFITAALSNRFDMINLPGEHGAGISVVFPFYQSTTGIPAILGWVMPSDDSTLLPNRHAGLKSEVISATVAVSISYCCHKNGSGFRDSLWGFPQSYWNQKRQSLGYCSAKNYLASTTKVTNPKLESTNYRVLYPRT